MARLHWQKGQGFMEHSHAYDHIFMVTSGEVRVRVGGRTFDLKAGEQVTHFKGTRLTASALTEAKIETNHNEGLPR